jgi:hypothetical protein
VVKGVEISARNLKTFDEIREGSLDYYATLRSLRRQCRGRDQQRRDAARRHWTRPRRRPEDETSELVTPPQVSLTVPVAGMAPPRSFVTVPPAAARISSSAFLIKEPNGPIPGALDP